MALNINGTTGISGVDGSASAPAVTGTDSNTGINFGTDIVNINTGGTTRASIDSAGKLSVTSTSTATNDSEPVATFTTQGHSQIRLNGDGNQWALMALDSSAAGNNFIVYDKNNSAERIRIDSAGRGFFNRTAALTGNTAMFQVNGGISIDDNSSYRNIYMSGSGHLYFYNGTNQGYLSSGGAWTDASDENLKKDITSLSYGIDSLKNLKPRKFKMKSDDKEQIGFIAQEVESVIPEVVDTGETPDGTEQKGLAYGHLTAVLTKALQEAVAKIEVLETKVAALEAG
jgi:hypothetical protein